MSPNPQETADLVTFTEEILYGKLRFLCIECPEYASDFIYWCIYLNNINGLFGKIYK